MESLIGRKWQIASRDPSPLEGRRHLVTSDFLFPYVERSCYCGIAWQGIPLQMPKVLIGRRFPWHELTPPRDTLANYTNKTSPHQKYDEIRQRLQCGHGDFVKKMNGKCFLTISPGRRLRPSRCAANTSALSGPAEGRGGFPVILRTRIDPRVREYSRVEFLGAVVFAH
ncbi:hypothetical protein G5I_00573 [Acromyrmex echinatior]|uniref:Uncharacterized protein n=1 Tax=Acromyrmex echinatior TaxID=103372 RepID=F4W581_ACREC|nr:hypothetical protein G5I_00573 [Acromyrmex echinatior]